MDETVSKILLSTWYGVADQDGKFVPHKEANCELVRSYLHELLSSCREYDLVKEFEIGGNSEIVISDIRYGKSNYIHLRWQDAAMLAVLSVDVNRLAIKLIGDISDDCKYSELATYFMQLAMLSDMCAMNYGKIHRHISKIHNVYKHLNPVDDVWDVIWSYYETMRDKGDYKEIMLPDWEYVYKKIEHFNLAVGYERRL